MGKKLKIPLVAALTVLVFMGVLELLMRLGYFQPSFADPGRFEIIFDRRALFRLKPHSGSEINNLGYRDRDFEVEKRGKKRILFLGDSFVMGLHVLPWQTLPKVLESELGAGYEVFNLGMYGYGPDQNLVRLLDEGLRFEPDMVILSLYPSNDFDDLLVNRIFSPDGRGGVRRNTENAVSAKMPALDSVYLMEYLLFKFGLADMGFTELFRGIFGEQNNDTTFALSPQSEEARLKEALMRGVMREYRDELGKRGVGFLVIVLPSIWNVQDTGPFLALGVPPEKLFANEDMAARILREESIRHINFYPLFMSQRHDSPLYDPDDHHLSAYGHMVVAGAIARELLGGEGRGGR